MSDPLTRLKAEAWDRDTRAAVAYGAVAVLTIAAFLARTLSPAHP